MTRVLGHEEKEKGYTAQRRNHRKYEAQLENRKASSTGNSAKEATAMFLGAERRKHVPRPIPRSYATDD